MAEAGLDDGITLHSSQHGVGAAGHGEAVTRGQAARKGGYSGCRHVARVGRSVRCLFAGGIGPESDGPGLRRRPGADAEDAVIHGGIGNGDAGVPIGVGPAGDVGEQQVGDALGHVQEVFRTGQSRIVVGQVGSSRVIVVDRWNKLGLDRGETAVPHLAGIDRDRRPT